MTATPHTPAAGIVSGTGRILVVDDEVELKNVLCESLAQAGYDVHGYCSGHEALTALRAREFDVLLTDLMMPALDGLSLLRQALETDPNLIVILMTGQGTVSTAVEAMKSGAFDYLLKPFKLNALLPVLVRALDVRRLRRENIQLREAMAICELNQAVSSVFDTAEILNRVVDTARAEYQADEAAILLPDADGESLVVAATRGTRAAPAAGARQPLTAGIAGWVARERQLLTLHGAVHDARFASLHLRPDIRHALCVPMLAGDKLVGVLSLNRLHQERPFTAGQTKAIKVFANTAATALESARLHEQVRASEERYRRVLENVDEIVYMIEIASDDPFATGPVPFVSRHVQDIIGYRPEEFVADPELWSRLLHPDDRAAVEAQTRTMFTDRQPVTREYRLRHKLSGEYRWMEDRALPQLDASGRLVSLFGVARDITDRRHADAEMRKLSSAVEQTADSVIITDSDGVIEYVNPAFELTTGYTRAEVLGQKPSLVKSGQHGAEFYQQLWQTLRRGESFRDIFVNRRKDGSLYHEEKSITPLKDVHGKITHFVSAGKDITARVAAEQETRYTQHFLNSVVENLPNMLFVKDAKDLRFVRFNKAAEELLGYPRAAMLGKNDYDFFPKAEADLFTNNDRAVLASGALMDIPLESIQTRHRGERWLHTRKIPIFDESGQPLYLLGISEDITGHKQTEDRAARLGRILDSSANEIYVFDAQTLTFLQVNAGACKNLGYSMQELGGLTPLDLKPEFDRARFEALIAPLHQGTQEVLVFETEHRRKDGSLYPVEVRLQLSRNETPPVFVAIILDISERKQAEERFNYLAYHDSLTGLPNRLRLLEYLT